jgi:hypothetical protein
LDYVHYFIYRAEGMAFIYGMLCELGFIVRVFVIVVMLTVPYTEGAAGVLAACGACELVEQKRNVMAHGDARVEK